MEWVCGRSLIAFIDRYNAAGIAKDSIPVLATQKASATAASVLTSEYISTQESAIRLNLSIQSSESKYREVNCWIDFPVPFPLPAWVWVILTRILWPMNRLAAPESFREAQLRAKNCDQSLAQVAQGRHVVLVGHGGMNTLIARELVAMKWEGAKQPRLNHWGATSYLK